MYWQLSQTLFQSTCIYYFHFDRIEWWTGIIKGQFYMLLFFPFEESHYISSCKLRNICFKIRLGAPMKIGWVNEKIL